MALDGKGKPKSKDAVKGYAYPISNPNVMEAHIFQLKKDIPAELGGGVMWLSIGSPRNAPYLPHLGNISKTYEAYQEKSTKYNDKSWYWRCHILMTLWLPIQNNLELRLLTR